MKKIITLLILFVSINVFAASSGTWTIGIGGDFTGLIAAEVGLNGNLIAPCTIQYITGGIDNCGDSYVNVAGWTTSATAYLLIEVAPNVRHKGVWNETYATLKSSNSSNECIYIQEEYVRIDGLQIEQSTSSVMVDCIGIKCVLPSNALGLTADLRVSNSIIRWINNSHPNNFQAGGAFYYGNCNSTTTIRFWNNIMIDFHRGFYYTNTKDCPNTIVAYSNTLYELAKSTRSGFTEGDFVISASTSVGKYVLKNNLAYSTTMCYALSATGYSNFISSNNISNDNTSPSIPYRGRTVSFVDATNFNFQPLSSDTTAYAQGVDLRTDPDGYINVLTDAAGNIRPATPTIGALEAQSQSLLRLRRKNISVHHK